MKKSIIDDAFDIEPIAFDNIVKYNQDNKSIVPIKIDPEYDDKHIEIETQFQDIYNKAIDAFDTQVDATDDIEAKYLARNSEVANQLLGTALQAAKEKASLKKHSDNLKIRKPESNNTTNIQNNILMDRNELLKMMTSDDTSVVNDN